MDGDSSAGLWLAGLKHLCSVGVVWLRSVTATLENKPSIPTAERSWNPPVQRPQSTTQTHAMLVRCQIRGTRTLLHQYLLFGDSFAIQRGQKHSSEKKKKETTKAWFVFSLVKLQLAVQHVHVASKNALRTVRCMKHMKHLQLCRTSPWEKVQVYSSRMLNACGTSI